jgi:hypothetical protein
LEENAGGNETKLSSLQSINKNASTTLSCHLGAKFFGYNLATIPLKATTTTKEIK